MTDTLDTVAMALSSTFILTGVVVLGALEILDGAPYGAAPVTNEAGEVVAQPGVDPAIRTGLVLAGLAILALWAGYRVLVPAAESETPADADPATQ
jgi:hypothetical protein